MFDLAFLGWDATFTAAYRGYADRDDTRPGRVARVEPGVCTVLTAAGTVRASLAGAVLAASASDPGGLPCTGDWVVVRTWLDGRVTVEAVLPRRTSLVWPTAGRGFGALVIAANLDVVAVVESMERAPDFGRVARLLALARDSGARPVVLLTKADLVADSAATARVAAVAAHVAAEAPGVLVAPVSARIPGSLDPVRPLAGPGHTLALLGRAGAGKSTLVNALAGASVLTARPARRAGERAGRGTGGRGMRTTQYQILVPVPGGGAVVDTPGLRGECWPVLSAGSAGPAGPGGSSGTLNRRGLVDRTRWGWA